MVNSIAKNITYFCQGPWRHLADTDQEASSILDRFHSARECYSASGWERNQYSYLPENSMRYNTD